MILRAFLSSWLVLVALPAFAQDTLATFDELMAHKVTLKPELVGVHPRVFVTRSGLDALRERTRTTHRADWVKATAKYHRGEEGAASGSRTARTPLAKRCRIRDRRSVAGLRRRQEA